MLMCWNEHPLQRPTFTELRSRFDSMLLADKNGDYIDLRIDQNKLYYQLVGASSSMAGAPASSDDLKLKKQSSDTTLKSHGSQNEMEQRARSKSPATLDAPVPGLKSSCASCIDQTSTGDSQLRPQFLTLGRGATTAGGSSGMLGPGPGQAMAAGRDRTNENTGRPVSMYVSGDRDRRERQNNPYVDEPSRMAFATSLTLTNGGLNGHVPGQWSSDGAIEMSQMDGYVEMNGGVKGQAGPKMKEQNGPEIKISFS